MVTCGLHRLRRVLVRELLSAKVRFCSAHATLDLGEEGEGHAAPDAVVRHDEVHDAVRGDIVNQAVLPHVCLSAT